jgi:hypothetical protein
MVVVVAAEVEEAVVVVEEGMYHHSNRPLCMIECQPRNKFANNILGLANSKTSYFQQNNNVYYLDNSHCRPNHNNVLWVDTNRRLPLASSRTQG